MKQFLGDFCLLTLWYYWEGYLMILDFHGLKLKRKKLGIYMEYRQQALTFFKVPKYFTFPQTLPTLERIGPDMIGWLNFRLFNFLWRVISD